MSQTSDSPSYDALFGSHAHAEVDPGRSVLSPAAYLADLLQLVGDEFEPKDEQDLLRRRPDLAEVPLDGEHTHTLVSVLEIVNERLEALVSGVADPQGARERAWAMVAQAKHPVTLPANLDHARLRLVLELSGLDSDDLLSGLNGDPAVSWSLIARERLGLAPELLEALDEQASLSDLFGAGATPEALAEVATLRTRLGITAREIRQLLYGETSLSARPLDQRGEWDASGAPERARAEALYVHQGLTPSGRITLDPEGERLVHIEGTLEPARGHHTWDAIRATTPPEAWFVRVNQMVRLARATGWSLLDLERALRTCCEDSELGQTLRRLAVISRFARPGEVSISRACALFAPLDRLGLGEATDMAAAPFDEVFNGTARRDGVRVDSGAVHQPVAHVVGAGEVLPALPTSGDLLGAELRDLRRRVERSLNMSPASLHALVTSARARARAPQADWSVPPFDPQGAVTFADLDCLQRCASLADHLEVDGPTLLVLLDVVGGDRSLRAPSPLSPWMAGQSPGGGTVDGLRVLYEGTVAERFWLVATVVAVGRWAAQVGIEPAQLREMVVGPPQPADEAALRGAERARRALLKGVWAAFESKRLSHEALVGAGLTPRTARLAMAVLAEPARGLTSASAPGLLGVEDPAALRAAADAVVRASVAVHPEDFAGSGLGVRLAERLHRQLRRVGLVDAQDRLNPTALASWRPEDGLETELGDLPGLALTRLQALHAKAAEITPAGEPLELSFFPSDLDALGTQPHLVEALFDNLTHNRFLAPDGTVVDPDRLRDGGTLPSASGLDALASAVHGALTAWVDAWLQAPLVVEAGALADALELTAERAAALVATLQFNGYIDDDGRVLDKLGVLALDPETADLAISFLPRRAAIVAALQATVEADRDASLRCTVDALTPLAEQAAGAALHAALQGVHLEGGQVLLTSRAALRDERAGAVRFEPGPYVDAGVTVHRQLRERLEASSPIRLTAVGLASYGFTADEAHALIEVLKGDGRLAADETIAPAWLEHFAVSNHAEQFHVEGYADYRAEVFALLHGAALEHITQRDAVVEAVLALQAAQEVACVEALNEWTGVEAQLTALVLRALVPAGQTLAEALLPAAWRVDLADGQVNTLLRRARQLGKLLGHFGLDARAAKLLMDDEALVWRMPERLRVRADDLPFDAVLPEADGSVRVFKGRRWRLYDGVTGRPTDQAGTLSDLSNELAAADPPRINGAWRLADGTARLVAGDLHLRRGAGEDRWSRVDVTWQTGAADLGKADAIASAVRDADGRLCLFEGGHYIRYSESVLTAGALDVDHAPTVDLGYPRPVSEFWAREAGVGEPVVGPAEAPDAAAVGPGERLVLFREGRWWLADEPARTFPIAGRWGMVDNPLADAERVDAVVELPSGPHLVAGGRAVAFRDALDAPGLHVEEGSLQSVGRLLPEAPAPLLEALDAGFIGWDGRLHLFGDGQCVQLTRAGAPIAGESLRRTAEMWGKLVNPVAETGAVDAALAGLDGRVYLFGGALVYRYSGRSFSAVDEGWPRRIEDVFAGLAGVELAFTLDGHTHLVGVDRSGARSWVRYSTRDYATPDKGFPKAPADPWWSLPAALEDSAFATPTAVFTAPSGETILFAGESAIGFDRNRRWWSQPVAVSARWPGLGFTTVAAAFTGADGRVYLFEKSDEAPRFGRYADSTFQRIDPGFPRQSRLAWGRIRNNIERTGRVDAAIALQGADGLQLTYLFSGDQFFRYEGAAPQTVQMGYPRRIADALAKEPHFQALTRRLSAGIDGACADRRTIWLFSGGEAIVLASAGAAHYAAPAGFDPVVTVDTEDGGLYLAQGDGWVHHRGAEALPLAPAHRERLDRPAATLVSEASPRALQTIADPDFRHGLDAVLRGLDDNLYVFKAGQVFDRNLGHALPIQQVFGRVHNPLWEHGRVDAALAGEDGSIHVFSGDIFVTYRADEGEGASGGRPRYVAGLPKPIAEHWGGLKAVRVAYRHEGRTVLAEPPGLDGRFRVQRWSGGDGQAPDSPEPQWVDFSHWGLPAAVVTAGFDRVDAVMVHEGDVALIRGRQYVAFDVDANRWGYPRPITHLMPGLAHAHPQFEDVRTVLVGHDGHLVVFSDTHYVETVDGELAGVAPAPTAGDWGRLKNEIGTDGTVQAALVHGPHTYLFGPSQYVRYTGAAYRYVDPGYPRPLVGALRQEPAFARFGPALDDRLDQPEQEGPRAVWSTDGAVYLLEAVRGEVQLHASSPRLEHVFPLSRFTALRNVLVSEGRVDAAFNRGKALYLISGDQYVRYADPAADFVDDGYPRALAGLGEELFKLPPLEGELALGVDAAVALEDDTVLLFRGPRCTRLSGAGAQAHDVADVWGHLDNPLAGENPTVDAAFVDANGRLWAMRGERVVRLSDPESGVVDPGFPQARHEVFPTLPAAFGDDPSADAAYTFDSRVYFRSGPIQVCYSDPRFRAPDPGSPSRVADRWVGGADLGVAELRDIERFVALGSEAMVELLDPDGPPQRDPFHAVAALLAEGGREPTADEVEDVRWLKIHDAFLARPADEPLSLELILEIADAVERARRVGCRPMDLHGRVLAPWAQAEPPLRAVADVLLDIQLARSPGRAADALLKQVADGLNSARRDALVGWLLSHGAAGRRFASAQDLSEYLLVDVLSEGVVQTSRVREAISVLQLYMHRYFLGQERLDPRTDQDAARRAKLKARWAWMGSYRAWEANRKVFLFPENYLRPELGRTKTVDFEALEQDILKGELTTAFAEKVFRTYLDNFKKVGSLDLAGGYVYPEPGDADQWNLLLVGRTKADPKQFYHRRARFTSERSDHANWEPWRPIELSIAAERVYPVYAFGQLLLFWTGWEPADGAETTTVTRTPGKNSTETVKAENAKPLRRPIFQYAHYKLDGTWQAPQTVNVQAEAVEDKAIEFGVSATPADPENPFKQRVLLRWSHDRKKSAAVEMQADFQARSVSLDHSGDESVSALNRLLKQDQPRTSIFQLGVEEGAQTQPWIGFTAGGGAFIARPARPEPNPENEPVEFSRGEGYPTGWAQVSGAVESVDGQRLFFGPLPDEPAGPVGLTQPWRHGSAEEALTDDRPLVELWGHADTSIRRDGAVDLAYMDEAGTLTLTRKGESLSFPAGQRRLAAPESPASNELRACTTAALKADGQTTVYFDADGRWWDSSDATRRDVRSHWGLARNALDLEQREPVVAAFMDQARVFLVGSDSFVVLDEDAVPAPMFEGAQPSTLGDVLAAMGVTPSLEDLQSTDGTAADLDARVTGAAGATSGAVDLFAGGLLVTVQGKQVSAVAPANGRTTGFVLSGERYDFHPRRGGMTRLRINGNDQEPLLERSVKASLLVDEGDQVRLSLFVEGSVHELEVTDRSPETVQLAIQQVVNSSAAGTPLATTWGGYGVFPEAGAAVEVAFRRGEHLYLVSGANYVRLRRDEEPFIADGVHALADGLHGLPTWDHIDAAATVDGVTWFFRNDQFACEPLAADGTPGEAEATALRWGLVSNPLLTHGVRAAVRRAGRLWLFTGSVPFSYNLAEVNQRLLTGGPVPGVEPPQVLKAEVHRADAGERVPDFDALLLYGQGADTDAWIFRVDEDVAQFAPIEFQDSGLPSQPHAEFKPISEGDWVNLPKHFEDGIDAVLVTGHGDRFRRTVHLFKGTKVSVFHVGGEGDAAPFPRGFEPYDIIRVSSATPTSLISRLQNQGGLTALLSLDAQLIDEEPYFERGPKTEDYTSINATPHRVRTLPASHHLDFSSANGLYYWEIFLHGPLFAAQTLYARGRFDEAKAWLEHIYDPTAGRQYWKFLPFLEEDLGAIIELIVALSERLGLVPPERFGRLAKAFQLSGPRRMVDGLQAKHAGDVSTSADRQEELNELVGWAQDQKAPSGNGDRGLLSELIHLCRRLNGVWNTLTDTDAALEVHLDRPFLAHAVAAKRRVAYRKAVVMQYVDNLLAQGDELFEAFTTESIAEARMVYMLAHTLLGPRPESVGAAPVSGSRSWGELYEDEGLGYDFLLLVADDVRSADGEGGGRVAVQPYFHLPPNDQFVAYWDRVEDRLFKIRNALNIKGFSQPLPLFQPPVDPMAVVAAGGGGGLGAALGATAFVGVPHYRYAFLLGKAQALVARASQLGEQLLAALEKRDAEALARLQARHEGDVLDATVAVHDARIAEAKANLRQLDDLSALTRLRRDRYKEWIEAGHLTEESVQVAMLGVAGLAHGLAGVLQAFSGIGHMTPDVLVGPFIMGVKYGGSNAGAALGKAAEVVSHLAEAVGISAEIPGILAQYERMKQEWVLQWQLAIAELVQIVDQKAAAEHAVIAARVERKVLKLQRTHNQALRDHYTAKFTNEELYAWMEGALIDLYRQTYERALRLAQAAEQAWYFERGLPLPRERMIRGGHWRAGYKGLLAGDQLTAEIEALEERGVEEDFRRLEVTRTVSLREHDPIALLTLRERGVATFALDEQLYARDFPGHYRRQLKTVAVQLQTDAGEAVHATLTQLSNRLLMEPDPKGARYLLTGAGDAPLALRQNWRPLQTIAVTEPDAYGDNNGLFELRYEAERYLPFEGTGAVSTWRLEAAGARNRRLLRQVSDLKMTVRFTALDGGAAYAEEVRRLLTPIPTQRHFDLVKDFPDAWDRFAYDGTPALEVKLTRELFPGMAGGRIASIYAKAHTQDGSPVTVRLGEGDGITLRDGAAVDTSGLTIRTRGTSLRLQVDGDRAQVTRLELVLIYRSKGD